MITQTHKRMLSALTLFTVLALAAGCESQGKLSTSQSDQATLSNIAFLEAQLELGMTREEVESLSQGMGVFGVGCVHHAFYTFPLTEILGWYLEAQFDLVWEDSPPVFTVLTELTEWHFKPSGVAAGGE